MEDGTFEVVAGLAILYAVIRLLKMIFEFITKIIASKKNGSDKAPISHATAIAHNCFTDDERARIMHVMTKLSAVDWKQQERQIDDLHEWLSAEDDEGVKRWIVPKSMKTNVAQSRDDIARLAMAIEQLSGTTATNAELFDRLLKALSRNSR